MVAHTLFSASPFKPKGYDQAVTPVHQLGLNLDDFVDFFGDFLGVDDLNAGNVDEFLSKLDSVIDELPVGAVKSGYTTRRAECMAKGVPSKYLCLWDLFQDVKRTIRNGDGVTPTTVTPPAVPPPSRAAEFPWVPVGIAAGIGTAALLYLVFRPKVGTTGKKK